MAISKRMDDLVTDVLIKHYKANGYKREEIELNYVVVMHNCKTDEDCEELIEWLKKNPTADKEKILLHVYCRRDGIAEN